MSMSARELRIRLFFNEKPKLLMKLTNGHSATCAAWLSKGRFYLSIKFEALFGLQQMPLGTKIVYKNCQMFC